MEKAAADIMASQIDDETVPSDLRGEIKVHLVQTFRHIRDLEGLQTPSSAPEAPAPQSSLGQAVGAASTLAPDPTAKAVLQAYMLGNCEIGFYLGLIALANSSADTVLAATCEKILAEERKMAAWIEGHYACLVTGACVSTHVNRNESRSVVHVEDIDAPPEEPPVSSRSKASREEDSISPW